MEKRTYSFEVYVHTDEPIDLVLDRIGAAAAQGAAADGSTGTATANVYVAFAQDAAQPARDVAFVAAHELTGLPARRLWEALERRRRFHDGPTGEPASENAPARPVEPGT